MIQDNIITKRHYRRMNLTIRLSKKSVFPKYRMAAILFKSGGKPLAIGFNKDSSGESYDKRYDLGRAIHAELDVILQAARKGIQTEGATLYVAGLTKADNLCLSSKPCRICQQIIYEAGIKDVYFHDGYGNLHKMNIN